MSALLEAGELHTYYGQSHVLHGVSFSIAPGEIVTLMGRNGMGSTAPARPSSTKTRTSHEHDASTSPTTPTSSL